MNRHKLALPFPSFNSSEKVLHFFMKSNNFS